LAYGYRISDLSAG